VQRKFKGNRRYKAVKGRGGIRYRAKETASGSPRDYSPEGRAKDVVKALAEAKRKAKLAANAQKRAWAVADHHGISVNDALGRRKQLADHYQDLRHVDGSKAARMLKGKMGDWGRVGGHGAKSEFDWEGEQRETEPRDDW
jgi:hypothetical protein